MREEMIERKKQQNQVITAALLLYEQALSDLRWLDMHPHEVRRTWSCRWEHIFLGQKTIWSARCKWCCVHEVHESVQAGDRDCHSGTQQCLQLQCTNLGRSVSVLLTCRVCSKGTFHRSLNHFVTKERGNFEWFPKLLLPNALGLTKMFSKRAVNFLIEYVLIGI